MLDVLSVGHANMDFIIKGDTFKGSNIMPLVLPGGSASNYAVGLSKLNLKSGFIGFVGNDYFGKSITDNLKNYGVKAYLTKTEKSTGIALIFLKSRMKRIIRFLGANELLTNLNLKPYVKETKHLHLATPPITLLKYLKDFKSVSVDPCGSISEVNFEKLKPYFKDIDLFMPNRLEIESICDCKYDKAAKMIIDAGCKLVIVKRRWHGCYVTDGREVLQLKPFPCKENYLTGIGDSFGAAFLGSWLKGNDLKTCSLHGLASSNKELHHPGSQNSASQEEIDEIIKKGGYQFTKYYIKN